MRTYSPPPNTSVWRCTPASVFRRARSCLLWQWLCGNAPATHERRGVARRASMLLFSDFQKLISC